MPADLDCAPNLRLALMHIEMGSYKLAYSLLQQFEGCHQRHTTCPYAGEDCAVQDVIDGFHTEMLNLNTHDTT